MPSWAVIWTRRYSTCQWRRLRESRGPCRGQWPAEEDWKRRWPCPYAGDLCLRMRATPSLPGAVVESPTGFGTTPTPAPSLRRLAVPLFELEPAGCGGTTKRRRWHRQGHLALANEFLSATNWLQGHRRSYHGAAFDPVHGEVRARAASLGFGWSRDADARFNDEAALRELLKGRAVYDVDSVPTTLKPFKQNLVSRPASLHDAPFLCDVVSPDASIYLSGFEQRMFHPAHTWERLLSESTIKPYTDPSLKRNRRKYINWCQVLIKSGQFRFTTKPRGFCGMFFVGKNRQPVKDDSGREACKFNRLRSSASRTWTIVFIDFCCPRT